jgi:MFS family permease
VWTELLAVTTPTRRELLVALLVLVAAGAALFGPQVADGGFYWDDWQNAANVHIAGDPGLFASLDRGTLRPVFGYRPVLTVMLVVEHWALGLDKHLHLAMAALFGVLTAWALFALLRVCGLRRLDAAVPAGLLLAFPWADSTRMWATASFDTLAVAMYLGGLALAVGALRGPPGRVRIALSLVLYLLASWTYEVVTIPVLASVALYLCVAPRRAALRRWALDALVVAIALAVVATGTSRTPQSLSTQVDHAGTLASQAFSLLARALVPVGDVPGWIGAAVLVSVPVYGWLRGERRWVVVAGLGALLVVCGYVLFVPAAPYYRPLSPGTITRMNVAAAAGYAVLVYALVRIVTGRRAWLAPALCVLIGAGYVVKVADDEQGWQRSARVQAQVLHAIPRPSVAGTTYYTYGAPKYVAPGIPAFSLPFDLKAAVRLRDHTHLVAAYPLSGGNRIVCAADSLYPTGGSYTRLHGARYGHAVFVDVPAHRATAIRSRADCLRLRP